MHEAERVLSRRFFPGRNAMLLVLTAAAGAVDALSYLALGGVFTAMMTGNTVLLGLAIGHGQFLAAVRSLVALAGFALGVAAGALLVRDDGGRQEWPRAVTVALGVETALLGAVALLWWTSGTAGAVVYLQIALSALAMGVQSAAVRRLGVPGIATTYITGTLTALMVDLATSAAQRERNASRLVRVVRGGNRLPLLAAVFVVYAGGALVGAVLDARAPALLGAAPGAAVALVTLNAWLRRGAPEATAAERVGDGSPSARSV